MRFDRRFISADLFPVAEPAEELPKTGQVQRIDKRCCIKKLLY